MAVNLAKLISQQFGKNGKPIGVTSCTLTKTAPGTRRPGAVSAGTNPISTSYSATGMISDYKAYQIDGTLIVAGDRRVTLFGASIAQNQVPEPNDQITIGGTTYTITANGVTGDGVGATYQCNVRK